MANYTIDHLETAINWWSAQAGAKADRVTLSREVSILAEPYAEAIVTPGRVVDNAKLSADCIRLLEEAHGALGTRFPAGKEARS